MKWYEFLFVFVFIKKINSFNFENITIDDSLKLLIPTVKSTNLKCKNHSIFYMEELKNLKLWATEMFDASSKFPSGVLFGSSYEFGNFDECLEVKVPEENIQGRYCMAKFHIAPPDFAGKSAVYNSDNAVNVSVWDKVIAFSKDKRSRTRNDFYFSYCIPSSCHYNDLETSLKQVTEQFNSFSNFKVTASVNSLNCHLTNNVTLNTGDIIFITVIVIFISIVLIATIYNWLIKLDDLQKYKLEGNKHAALISFSVWANLKKLSTESDDNDGLQCIHGFKVISMFLIIMGHRIMFMIGSPILNPNFVEDMYERLEMTVLLNGPIIVDTFFNISGFLACYLMLLKFKNFKKNINFIFLYIHRFIRLTPAYAIVLGFYCTIFIKIGSGPFWLERIQVEQERCLASWWANLIYLNNYINKNKICMFQSWYMTCDMHYFIIAPIIVWLLLKKPFLGLIALTITIIMSISVVFMTVYLNNEDGILLLFMRFLKDPVSNNTFKNIYIPTHMRASPYFVGMITGYLKYIMKSKKYKMPKYMVYMGWIMCIFVIEITVYTGFIFYLPGKPYSSWMSATYAAMHHFTWSLCISWMILAISEGNGAWIEPVLSWKPLILMSRITYSAFLCHGAIQMYTVASLRYGNYVSVFNVLYSTASDITLAYIAGLALSMVFEAPVLGIEKILMRKNSDGIKNGDKDKSKVSTVTIPQIKIISHY